MATACLPSRTPLLAMLTACATIALVGCHTIDFYDPSLEAPVSPEMEPPREKALMSLPPYRIAAPDLLQIEMLKQVPLPPYRAEAYDVLLIEVTGTLSDYPIGKFDNYGRPTENGGNFLIEAEGTISLGPVYGTVRVIGMTIEEIRQAIDKHLRQTLAEPEVSVQLARSSGTQPVTAEYLIGPDGMVNLRQYGSVHVAGMTVAEAKVAIEKQLAQYFDSPEVSVSVLAYNSKVYYIVTQGAGAGDSILRVPITGKETALDAIVNAGGRSQMSSKKIWIARPAPADVGCQQILPIDYDAVTRGADGRTNYQLMPGDRVFIAEDETLALTSFVGTVIGPFERVAGFIALGSSSLKNMQTLGRGYNQQFRR